MKYVTVGMVRRFGLPAALLPLADGAAWPIKNCIKKFRPELEEYIKRTNPTGWAEEKAVPAMELVGIH